MEKVYTKNAPEAIGPYSQAVKVGGLLFTSGQIPLIPETGELAQGDIAVRPSSPARTWPPFWRRRAASSPTW